MYKRLNLLLVFYCCIFTVQAQDSCRLLLNEAAALARAEQFGEALLLYNRAGTYADCATEAAKQLEQLRKLPRFEAVKEQQYQDALVAGRKAQLQEDWAAAVHFFDIAANINTGSLFAAARRDELKSNIAGKEMLRGDSAFAAGSYESAYCRYRAAVFEFPSDSAAEKKMLRADSAMRANDPETQYYCGWKYMLKIPSSFSPNSERYNSGWNISWNGQLPDTFEVWLFNRWGDLVFKSNDCNFSWDGRKDDRPLQEDTYVWKIVFRHKNEIRHKMIGQVKLVR